MDPDGRLVDVRQVDLARELCQAAISYTEQELGLRTLHPPTGKALIRRLQALRSRLEQLGDVIDALSEPPHSAQRTPPD